jgi:hypothetical protein
MKDANWLKSQFDFPLVPTNMEGVYTLPPLPDSLDLKNRQRRDPAAAWIAFASPAARRPSCRCGRVE